MKQVRYVKGKRQEEEEVSPQIFAFGGYVEIQTMTTPPSSILLTVAEAQEVARCIRYLTPDANL